VNRNVAHCERLVEDHLDLPRRLAALIFKRVRRHVELDDLIAFGNTGLVDAARRFDSTRHVSFETFAWYRVYGAIIDGVRRLAPLPRDTWRALASLRRERARITRADPSETITMLDVQIAATGRVYSVAFDEAAISTATPVTRDPAEVIDIERSSIRACEAIGRLPRPQRDLLRKHYWQDKDLLTAGAELGRSKSWASRNHAEALDRLRHDMREMLDAA
jgi:RNA polymerase sigma factor for flagellar operon FliA